MRDNHDRFLSEYQQVKDKLFNYLMYRLSFKREEAEDLLMDVVLKAYENFDKFDEKKGTFKTWMFTLTHNHLVNHWRNQAKKKTISLDAIEEAGVTVATIEAEDTASSRIESENIKHILSLMNDTEREMISLKYLEDLNNREIAEVLGKNEGAVRTGLSRALRRFAELHKKLYS